MNKYISILNTTADFFSFIASSECMIPHLSLTRDDYKVHYVDCSYLTFTALEEGTFTLTIGSGVSTSLLESVAYSIDEGETWTTASNQDDETVTLTTPTIRKGDRVLWKGVGTSMSVADTSTAQADRLASSSIFSSSGKFIAEGNVMSLLYGDDFKGETSFEDNSSSNLALLFYNSKIVSADKMYLPATTATDNVYLRMFNGCSLLLAAPDFLLMTLADNCCYAMFNGCTSLKTLPNDLLPATTMTAKCYQIMFANCTSLKEIPNGFLPATTLANDCYRGMFANCISLKEIPNGFLPATTLANDCYRAMFQQCTSLKTLPSGLLPARTLANDCYHGMFYGCTSLKTLPNGFLPATTLANGCYYVMFYGCTSLKEIQNDLLAATTLANECYYGMFYGCTSLKEIPNDLLPATTLANDCYHGMFQKCTSLKEIPNGFLPATTLANVCYRAMFQKCTSLTTVPSDLLPATTLANECYYGMFNGCTSLTTAPELPATTLAEICYDSMFYGCISLTTAPELPATTLVYGCYRNMFFGCYNLNSITCLATDISASECTFEWMKYVSSRGTFTKHISTDSWTRGISGIPSNWTVKNDYEVLEYIASTSDGGQYIDLDINLYETLNNWYDIAIKFTLIGDGLDGDIQSTIFGCQENISPYPGTFIRKMSDEVRGRYIGGTARDNIIGTLGTLIELPVQTAPNRNVTDLNNSNMTHTWGTSLFCIFTDANRTPGRRCEAKLYYFKLFSKTSGTSQGTLIRDMVPCKTPYGTVGLFDMVNDKFYKSPNNAAFVAGPAV